VRCVKGIGGEVAVLNGRISLGIGVGTQSNYAIVDVYGYGGWYGQPRHGVGLWQLVSVANQHSTMSRRETRFVKMFQTYTSMKYGQKERRLKGSRHGGYIGQQRTTIL
jgi:hypothetical protein